jgi:hypothetical protein
VHPGAVPQQVRDGQLAVLHRAQHRSSDSSAFGRRR